MTKNVPSRVVEQFEPYPEGSYVNVDLTGLAAFTIERLNELHLPNTFENLVVALFRLFPAKFSLVGFDEYPDAARVGRTLLQLGPKYRNWARGSVQKGFVLTEAGKAKVADVARILAGAKSADVSRRQEAIPRTRPRTRDFSKDIQTIEESPLYRRWKTEKILAGTSMDLFDLLGAFAYTPARVLRDRLKMLETIAEEVERADIAEFLKTVRKEFGRQLQD